MGFITEFVNNHFILTLLILFVVSYFFIFPALFFLFRKATLSVTSGFIVKNLSKKKVFVAVHDHGNLKKGIEEKKIKAIKPNEEARFIIPPTGFFNEAIIVYSLRKKDLLEGAGERGVNWRSLGVGLTPGLNFTEMHFYISHPTVSRKPGSIILSTFLENQVLNEIGNLVKKVTRFSPIYILRPVAKVLFWFWLCCFGFDFGFFGFDIP